VSICVSDADAGLAFYRDVLGCTPLPRPDLGPGHWLDAGGQQVHLMQADDSPPRSNHFAFRVDEAESTINALTILERGYPANEYLGTGKLTEPGGISTTTGTNPNLSDSGKLKAATRASKALRCGLPAKIANAGASYERTGVP